MAEKPVKEVVEELLARVNKLENESIEVEDISNNLITYNNVEINHAFRYGKIVHISLLVPCSGVDYETDKEICRVNNSVAKGAYYGFINNFGNYSADNFRYLQAINRGNYTEIDLRLNGNCTNIYYATIIYIEQ